MNGVPFYNSNGGSIGEWCPPPSTQPSYGVSQSQNGAYAAYASMNGGNHEMHNGTSGAVSGQYAPSNDQMPQQPPPFQVANYMQNGYSGNGYSDKAAEYQRQQQFYGMQMNGMQQHNASQANISNMSDPFTRMAYNVANKVLNTSTTAYSDNAEPKISNYDPQPQMFAGENESRDVPVSNGYQHPGAPQQLPMQQQVAMQQPQMQLDRSMGYVQPPPPMTSTPPNMGATSMPVQSGTAPGINFDNYNNIPISVKGDNVPAPIETFLESEMTSIIVENVKMAGYTRPTPVQKHAIPTLVAGRDLMACAQTGSGKTAAFLLPIINTIVNQRSDLCRQTNPMTRRVTQYPYALILSPTRELAMQIHKEAQKFSYRTNVVTAMFYGGRENYRDQLMKIKNGCHIIIATPGRLIDVVQQGYLSVENIRYLVLDEADRMLDMGFEPQIRKIVGSGMPDKMRRQTSMFSATFPKEIKALAEDFLKPDFIHLAVGRVGSTSENIEQNIVYCDDSDKRKNLEIALEREDPSSLVLVFVETRRAANDLAAHLQRNGVRALAIHGDLKQPDRERNLEMFKEGINNILVATAVAARGLDIPNVKHVINYDMPNDVDEYVHRIGRTGRCGNVGTATSFFVEKNRGMCRDLLAVLVESGQQVPEWLPAMASNSGSGRGKYNSRGRGTTRGGSTYNPRGAPNGFRGGVMNGGPRGGMGPKPNGAPMMGGGMPPMDFGAPGGFPMNAFGQPAFSGGMMPGNFRGRGGNFSAPRGFGGRGAFRGAPFPHAPMMPMHGGPSPIFRDWQPRTAMVPN